MPTIEEWNLLVESKFDGHEKNYSNYIAVLQALGANPGAKLFDFGCSWGYGSYQLSQAGFEVDAYEISEDRAAFAARQLNISLCNPAEAIPGSYDYFFSAHVIEHVPSVSKMFQTGMRLLKPGGLFVAFAPNGSLDFRRAAAEAWHQRWGFVHPQMIDEEFLTNLPEANSLIAMSSPWSLDAIRSWEAGKRVIDSMEGDELFFAVRKN